MPACRQSTRIPKSSISHVGNMQDDLSARPRGQRSKAVIDPNARLHVDAEVVFEGNIHWHQRVRDVDWA